MLASNESDKKCSRSPLCLEIVSDFLPLFDHQPDLDFPLRPSPSVAVTSSCCDCAHSKSSSVRALCLVTTIISPISGSFPSRAALSKSVFALMCACGEPCAWTSTLTSPSAAGRSSTPTSTNCAAFESSVGLATLPMFVTSRRFLDARRTRFPSPPRRDEEPFNCSRVEPLRFSSGASCCAFSRENADGGGWAVLEFSFASSFTLGFLDSASLVKATFEGFATRRARPSLEVLGTTLWVEVRDWLGAVVCMARGYFLMWSVGVMNSD